MTCDQCQAACINGVFCHETGCPNSRKTWVPDRGWVLFVECRECGCDVEVGTSCDCFNEEWEPDPEPEDMMKSMTYGTLPTREEFNEAFERECPNGYHITLGRSDARALAGFKLGSGVWTSDQLWEAIREITCYSWPDELALNLVSGIMETLGFEWI